MGSTIPTDQRDRRGGGANRVRRQRPRGDDNFWLIGGEFGCESREAFNAIRVVSIVDLDITADDPTVFAQAARPSTCPIRYLGLHQNADGMNRLRRAGSQRGPSPSRRA
jgi:hypothetical protein